MSRIIPPPSPVATASTRTPKRSICFLPARIPPLRPKEKVPIRLSTRLRGSSIPRRQGALVVFLHNCERLLDRPNRWVTQGQPPHAYLLRSCVDLYERIRPYRDR